MPERPTSRVDPDVDLHLAADRGELRDDESLRLAQGDARLLALANAVGGVTAGLAAGYAGIAPVRAVAG